MSGITLYADNILERASSVGGAQATAAGFDRSRLYDRDRGLASGLVTKAAAAGDFDIDVVMPVATPASTLVIVTQNGTGNVEIYADTASAIGTTLIATLALGGLAIFAGTFTLQNATKYRVRAKGFGTPWQGGELVLDVPHVVAASPALKDGPTQTLGQVVRDYSPVMYPMTTIFGGPLAYMPYRWPVMKGADLTEYKAAFSECSQGGKCLAIRARDGVLRWVSWLDDGIYEIPVGIDEYEVPGTSPAGASASSGPSTGFLEAP